MDEPKKFNFPYIYLDRGGCKKPIFDFIESDDYIWRMGWIEYQILLKDETLQEYKNRINKL